jgi:hypothetical protein
MDHAFNIVTHGLPVLGVLALFLFAGSKGALAFFPARAAAAALLALACLALLYRGAPAHAPRAPPRPPSRPPQVPILPATSYNYGNLTLPVMSAPYDLDYVCTSDGKTSGTRATCAPYFCSTASAKTTAPCAAPATTAANMTAYLADVAVRCPRANTPPPPFPPPPCTRTPSTLSSPILLAE